MFSLSHTMQSFVMTSFRVQLSPMVTLGPMVQFSMVTLLPITHGGISFVF